MWAFDLCRMSFATMSGLPRMQMECTGWLCAPKKIASWAFKPPLPIRQSMRTDEPSSRTLHGCLKGALLCPVLPFTSKWVSVFTKRSTSFKRLTPPMLGLTTTSCEECYPIHALWYIRNLVSVFPCKEPSQRCLRAGMKVSFTSVTFPTSGFVPNKTIFSKMKTVFGGVECLHGVHPDFQT